MCSLETNTCRYRHISGITFMIQQFSKIRYVDNKFVKFTSASSDIELDGPTQR